MRIRWLSGRSMPEGGGREGGRERKSKGKGQGEEDTVEERKLGREELQYESEEKKEGRGGQG